MVARTQLETIKQICFKARSIPRFPGTILCAAQLPSAGHPEIIQGVTAAKPRVHAIACSCRARMTVKGEPCTEG